VCIHVETWGRTAKPATEMKLGVKRLPRYILTRDVQSFLRLSQDFNYDNNRKALYERVEETTI